MNNITHFPLGKPYCPEEGATYMYRASKYDEWQFHKFIGRSNGEEIWERIIPD